MNVALSVTSFLIVLAAGVMLDGGRHSGGTQAGTTDPLSTASLAIPSDVMASPDNPAQSSDPSNTLLTRAHACAAAGDWACVIESTSNEIVQHGDTPETQALLEQAVVNGGWTPSAAAPNSPVANVPNVASAPPLPTRASQEVRHGHRSALRLHSAATRSGSTEDIAVLFRH
jgi:hypothetical protein